MRHVTHSIPHRINAGLYLVCSPEGGQLVRHCLVTKWAYSMNTCKRQMLGILIKLHILLFLVLKNEILTEYVICSIIIHNDFDMSTPKKTIQPLWLEINSTSF